MKRCAVYACLVLPAVSCTKEAEDQPLKPETLEANAIVIEDARGRTVVFDQPAIEVVSLVPSLTEYLFELERGHLLVARSRRCRYPNEAARIPVAGDMLNANVTLLREISPDVVLVSKRMPPNEVEGLEFAGLSVVVFDLENWESIQKNLLNLGKILDARGDIRTLLGWLDKQRQRIREEWEYAGKPRVSAAVFHSINPIIIAGPGNFINEIMWTAGGRNVVRGTAFSPQNIKGSQLVDLQPEVLIFSSEAAGELDRFLHTLESDPWSRLNAVGKNRVYVMDADYLVTPGPRQVSALRQMAAALHPEIFEAPAALKQVFVR